MIELDTIYNQDCMDGLKLLPDKSIDLILTDPPYRTTNRGNYGGTGGLFRNKQTMDGKIFKYNDTPCSKYAPELFRVLKDDAHCYVMTNHVNLQEMLNIFTDVGFHFIKSLIWDKGNKIMGQWYMSQYEYILFFRKGKAVRINNCGTSDIISIPNIKTKDQNGKNIHDTEKPVKLMELLIENSSQPGQLICDPFLGSGTTAVAAVKADRHYIGYEIDPGYFQICCDRLDEVEN